LLVVVVVALPKAAAAVPVDIERLVDLQLHLVPH